MLFQQNTFLNTKWKSKKSNYHKVVLYIDFYSKNKLKIHIGKRVREFLYYIEDNKVKITHINNYAQSELSINKNEIQCDPGFFGIKSKRKISFIKVK